MASTHAREGGQFLQMGQPQEAVKSFQKGLAVDPDDVDCLLGLVRTHLSTGAAGEAEAATLRLLKVRPDHAEAQAHLAMLRAQAGDAEALESLKTLAAAPTAGYFERFNLGGLLLDRGDLEGARQAYESALDVAPESAHVHFELGRIHLQQGQAEGAAFHFQKAAEGAPQEPMPLLMLSRAHAARGAVGLAIQAGTLALERAQGGMRRSVLEDLFRLYLTGGGTDGAKRVIQELRQLEPANTNYIYMHGLALMISREFREARALFEEVLRLSPKSWQSLHALSQVHLALGERDLARGRLEEAVALVPTDPGPANDLAVMLMEEQAHDRARPVLERVLTANPREAATHLNLAVAWYATDKAASIRHAKEAHAHGTGVVLEQAERLLKQLGA
ncbi:tetratricopeptide repeat protein [Pyxidicoccus fallax]|uniref:Tetratricopeptide repeat protein n=1 Tax=Pyxidicoccus fallax TaxID=394095 RepID=A0A848LBN6_9BACT|nr:tetratricopeptide repeat protein [Pyxidicoccus fallax]NMO16339.1 tetratricopeptide repeat protein [Pyxidicoccus fallax]NPC86034.1 tetratricopeptide repeat protein [Pyxidicoccus fallax]